MSSLIFDPINQPPLRYNPITDTDWYKWSHYRLSPPGTTWALNYTEARAFNDPNIKSKFPAAPEITHVSSSGMQGYITDYLSKPIEAIDIEEAVDLAGESGAPFNKEGWHYILNKWGGHLPVQVDSLPEGLVVPIGTPMTMVRSLDENVPWVVGGIEIASLRASWYSTTVSTLTLSIKKMLWDYAVQTSDEPNIDFMLNDFGSRGASSLETVRIGGAAFLPHFRGTDNIESVRYCKRMFDADSPGATVPAMEHSTVTSWLKSGEFKSYRNAMLQYNEGLIAIVIDSYNPSAALEYLGSRMSGIILARNGTIVFRPDSGCPVESVSMVMQLLFEYFGFTVNSKGFKVLPPQVRMIQGDGINRISIYAIINRMISEKISSDNLSLGMGGALLQAVDRDMLSFATKNCMIKVNGVERDVYKDPITDASKRSKSGEFMVFKNLTGFDTATRHAGEPKGGSLGNLLTPLWSVDYWKRNPVNMEDLYIQSEAGIELVHKSLSGDL